MAEIPRMSPRAPIPHSTVGARRLAWHEAVIGLVAVAGAAALAGPVAAAAAAATAAVAALVLWGLAARRAVEPADTVVDTEPVPAARDSELAAVLAQGETTLMYRPLRSLPELQLRGVEAELRWRHPVHGPLPPASWPAQLSSAVATGLLDAWLGPAFAQFAAWLPGLRQRGGATLWLRLPSGMLAGAGDGLADRVSAALAAHGLDPSMLVLRVPLRVSGRQAQLPEAARALQARGVTIAVDAFGAGSASLTHLNALPVRTVCLAPSFVARAGPDTPQRWVVESTARLAHSMGMSTLAEGVNQETQVLAMAAMGCELGVGEVCGPWLEGPDWTRRWSRATSARAA